MKKTKEVKTLKNLNDCPKCKKEMLVLRNGRKICLACVAKEKNK